MSGTSVRGLYQATATLLRTERKSTTSSATSSSLSPCVHSHHPSLVSDFSSWTHPRALLSVIVNPGKDRVKLRKRLQRETKAQNAAVLVANLSDLIPGPVIAEHKWRDLEIVVVVFNCPPTNNSTSSSQPSETTSAEGTETSNDQETNNTCNCTICSLKTLLPSLFVLIPPS